MCNRYHPTRAEIIRVQWELGEPATGDRTWRPGIGPWSEGPFIRAKSGEPELVVGIWALIGDRDKKPINRPRMTNCARWEELAQKTDLQGSVDARPALPDPGRSIRLSELGIWQERMVDIPPRRRAALAPRGHLERLDQSRDRRGVRELQMLTQNCGAHPLLNRFHKPELDLPPDRQDKRTVVPLEVAEFRTWLMGTNEDASALVRLRPVELYDAGPA